MESVVTHTLFVGSSNETGELHLDRIAKILSRRHDGFTVIGATGYWKNEREESAVIVLSAAHSTVRETIQELKEELEQQAVGMLFSGSMKFA